MMKTTLTAEATIIVDAAPAQVWKVLTTPQLIKKYLMGTNVSSEWEEGSNIEYDGEYEGKKYHDKGVIKNLNPKKYFKVRI